MIATQEVEAQCPYCYSPITLVCDLSVSEQSYVEDCEVCCRPICIRFTVVEGEIADFQATRCDD